MRTQKNESGQALIFVALSLAVLMGFMALAVDVGILFRTRRNMQIAADSAATAAALNYLYYGSVSSAKSAAIAAAAANGVTITTSDINTPPSTGPNSGTTAGAYFEVIPHQATGTTFMGVISNSNSVNVGARAVAGTPSASKACIWIGNATNAKDAFDLQGNAQIFAAGCGVYVNSSSSTAVVIKGNPANVTAAFFDVHGNYSGQAAKPPHQPTLPTVVPPKATRSEPFWDRILLLTALAVIQCGSVNKRLSTVLHSANGITCFSTANVVTLAGGATLGGGVIYVFENGVSINGNIIVGTTANGSTLDIGSNAGTLNQASNSVLNITAPTSGTYNGIAIMQPAGNTTDLQVQFGSNNETLDGMIYAPGAKVYLQDNGGGVTATGVVADTMEIKSSSLTIPSYSAAHPTTTPLRAVTMVE